MNSSSNADSSEPPGSMPVDGAQLTTPGGGGSTGSGLLFSTIRSEALEKFQQREIKPISIQAWSAGTGIPIARIREELAKLPPEWTSKTAAGTIMLSADAWAALWQGFELDRLIALPPPKNEAPAPVSLTVYHLPVNIRILEAKDETGRRVRVRVKDNRRWKPRQKIEARLVSPDTPDLYEITSRPPRRWGDPL